jgi:hypothetical protein
MANYQALMGAVRRITPPRPRAWASPPAA